jgi:hypothetical protein
MLQFNDRNIKVYDVKDLQQNDSDLKEVFKVTTIQSLEKHLSYTIWR